MNNRMYIVPLGTIVRPYSIADGNIIYYIARTTKTEWVFGDSDIKPDIWSGDIPEDIRRQHMHVGFLTPIINPKSKIEYYGFLVDVDVPVYIGTLIVEEL